MAPVADPEKTGRGKDIIIAAVEALRQVVRKHQVTAEEYQAAVTWLAEAGKQDYLPGTRTRGLVELPRAVTGKTAARVARFPARPRRPPIAARTVPENICGVHT